MASLLTKRFAMGATVSGGLLAGVTANRWLVEMPAWERIGVLPWADFLRAENHGIGAAFYPVIGLITILFTIGAAVAFYFDRDPQGHGRVPIYAAALLAIAYAIITRAILVPANYAIRAAGDNAGELERIFNRASLWWGVNDALHVIAFGLSVWALVEILSSERREPSVVAQGETRASVSGVMGG